MAGSKEIAARVAGITPAQVQQVFEAVHDITRTGEKVVCQGFGTFTNKHKEARNGRNPSTGADIVIPAKNVLHFKPSPGLDMNLPKPAGGRRRG